MVSALNKLPITASGMIFFGDPVTSDLCRQYRSGSLLGLYMQWLRTTRGEAESARAQADAILPLTATTRKP